MAQIKLQSEDNQIATISFESGAGEDRSIVIPKSGGKIATVEGMFDRSRKNLIINGNFDIWQRGTSQTTNGYGSADRWWLAFTGSSSSMERLDIPLGTPGLEGMKYGIRNTVTSITGTNNYAQMRHKIEGLRIIDGKTVTLSFWAKSNIAGNKIAVWFNGNSGTGGTPSTLDLTNSSYAVTLSTEWAKYTITHTYFSLSGLTLGTDNNDYAQLTFWFDAGTGYAELSGGICQQSGTFDIAQVQLEAGETATEFEYRTVGEELALCQRYFFDSTVINGTMSQYSTTYLRLNTIYYPVAMRTAPIIVIKTPPISGQVVINELYTSYVYNNSFCPFYSVASGGADGFAHQFSSLTYSADAEL